MSRESCLLPQSAQTPTSLGPVPLEASPPCVYLRGEGSRRPQRRARGWTLGKRGGREDSERELGPSLGFLQLQQALWLNPGSLAGAGAFSPSLFQVFTSPCLALGAGQGSLRHLDGVRRYFPARSATQAVFFSCTAPSSLLRIGADQGNPTV